MDFRLKTAKNRAFTRRPAGKGTLVLTEPAENECFRSENRKKPIFWTKTGCWSKKDSEALGPTRQRPGVRWPATALANPIRSPAAEGGRTPKPDGPIRFPSAIRPSHRPDQRLAERRQHPRQRHRPARLGPGQSVHPHPELAAAGDGHPRQLNFEVFVARIVFDRNSQVRFHKRMLTKAVAKTTVHAPVHARRLI